MGVLGSFIITVFVSPWHLHVNRKLFGNNKTKWKSFEKGVVCFVFSAAIENLFSIKFICFISSTHMWRLNCIGNIHNETFPNIVVAYYGGVLCAHFVTFLFDLKATLSVVRHVCKRWSHCLPLHLADGIANVDASRFWAVLGLLVLFLFLLQRSVQYCPRCRFDVALRCLMVSPCHMFCFPPSAFLPPSCPCVLLGLCLVSVPAPFIYTQSFLHTPHTLAR